jgi:hypothetical protein
MQITATSPASGEGSINNQKPSADATNWAPGANAAKRGPKGYGDQFWNKLRQVFIARLEVLGLPDPQNSDPTWRKNEDAIRFVSDEAGKILGKHRNDDSEIGRTTAQTRVKAWIEEYLAGNSMS